MPSFLNQSISRFCVVLIGFLAALFFLCFVSPVQARTIALVYDDSGSMGKADRWVYANYATQVLAASLREDDDLVSLRMNGGLVRDKLPQNIKQWPRPVEGAKTPYSAVEHAMQVIQSAPIQSKSGVVQADEKNWLIITTDGEFDRAVDSDLVRNFFDQTDGRVEVVFLLIGDANTNTAIAWKRVSPDQVRIFQVGSGSGGTGLVDKMNQIAALVAGRDNQEPTGITRSGNRIEFSSPYPVSRITLLMQQADHQSILPELTAANFTDASGSVAVDFTTKLIESRTGRQVKFPRKARVVHCLNNSIIPAGKYSLSFDQNIAGLPVKVLVETAVDLSVKIYDQQGQPLTASSGKLSVCDDELLQVGVSLMSRRNNSPLQLSATDLSMLEVKSLMAGRSSSLEYQARTGDFRSNPKKIGQGNHSLAIEARSPGYFFLKSNVLSLHGTPCRRQGVMSLNKPEWILPYTFSKQMEPALGVATLSISLGNNPYEGAERSDKLQVDGLPPGVELLVAGQKVSQKQPDIDLPLLINGQQLKVAVSRNRDFVADKPISVLLHFTSGPWVEWGDPITFQLIPQPRNIVLEVTPQQWLAPVTEMNDQSPVSLRLLINGKPVADDEFGMWLLDDEHDGYFSLKMDRDDGKKLFTAKPGKFFFSPVWTSVGDFGINLKLSGPFPLENFSSTLPVHIQWVPWWQRARNTILFFLGLFAFLWWLKRILTKKRFSRSGYVEYRRQLGRRKVPPKSEDLAGNILLSWLLPTKAEKRVIEGIHFKASDTKSRIMIVGGQLDNKARIGGLRLETQGDDVTQKDHPLNNNDELVIQGHQETEIYRYVK